MSTISNERLEKLSEYDCADRYEVMSMATELLALRKERERPVPVSESGHVRREVHVGGNTWVQCSTQAYERAKAEGKITRELYERPAQPVAVPVVPAAYEINSDATDYHRGWNACRAATLAAQPIDDDSLPYDPQIAEYEQMMEAELKAAAGAAYKVKSELSQMAEKLVRNTTALAVTLSAETDTTSQQLESLAGKAVGGWIPCSERMPEYGVDVQIFCSDTREQFVGFRCIGDNDFQYGHYEDFSLVCSPSHWQPLPEPPCK
ncbi:DUF551 domain-containing protein [Cronobacter universalis]|nr:DUF551 domain-containing protein [Cronobacter universalis]